MFYKGVILFVFLTLQFLFLSGINIFINTLWKVLARLLFVN